MTIYEVSREDIDRYEDEWPETVETLEIEVLDAHLIDRPGQTGGPPGQASPPEFSFDLEDVELYSDEGELDEEAADVKLYVVEAWLEDTVGMGQVSDDWKEMKKEEAEEARAEMEALDPRGDMYGY